MNSSLTDAKIAFCPRFDVRFTEVANKLLKKESCVFNQVRSIMVVHDASSAERAVCLVASEVGGALIARQGAARQKPPLESFWPETTQINTIPTGLSAS